MRKRRGAARLASRSAACVMGLRGGIVFVGRMCLPRNQRRQPMCDYSLAGLRTRLAVEGEELIIYRFPTGSLGLTSPAELEAHRKEFRGWKSWFDPREVPCAVCIPPGARLLLRDIPD